MRRRVIYRGRVQGVGFRATVASVARGYSVTGYVRNRRDGTVELVADGPDEEVDRFLNAVAESMDGYIRGTDSEEIPADEAYHRFEIRY